MMLLPFAITALILLSSTSAMAEIFLDPARQWQFYGDARLRYEADYDGTNKAGYDIDDRQRARTRIRAGLKYKPNDLITFDARVRTGANNAQQSPHISFYDFQGNDLGDAHVNFDRWYVSAKNEKGWIWAGRNNLPFWSLAEVFWDEDATVLGTAFGSLYALTPQDTFSTTMGVFTLPVGMRDFSGYLAAMDGVYAHTIKNTTYSFGAGYFDFMPDSADDDALLLADGNGFRKYKIATLNAEILWMIDHVPVVLSGEYLHNLQNYSATGSDVYAAQNRGRNNGYVVSIGVGDIEKQGDWMGAYYFTEVDALAINSSVASDEWVRWSSGNGQNRSNDMRGHQFNIGYAFTDRLNILARLYLAEAIATQEASNRFRIDLNYRF